MLLVMDGACILHMFSIPARALTKLSLGGNNDVITELFLSRGTLVSDIPAGDGKLVNLFLRCIRGQDSPYKGIVAQDFLVLIISPILMFACNFLSLFLGC